jgi:probable phosphoglycerate mutase
MPAQIFLVRHGETAWSLSGRHTGRTDLPLTGQGEQDARVLGEKLRDVAFSRVLASPRQRAQRTCELAGLGRTVEIEPDLAEWDYGDYEGRSSAEILQASPEWNIFNDGCPGGETSAQVSARADRLIGRLRGLDGNIALFTHGHFGRVLGVRWVGWPVMAAQHFLLGTAALSVLGHEHGGVGQPVIVRWNVSAREMPGH